MVSRPFVEAIEFEFDASFITIVVMPAFIGELVEVLDIHCARPFAEFVVSVWQPVEELNQQLFFFEWEYHFFIFVVIGITMHELSGDDETIEMTRANRFVNLKFNYRHSRSLMVLIFLLRRFCCSRRMVDPGSML
ncbi:hypothetical protein D3C80_1543890 [compost metagenome]